MSLTESTLQMEIGDEAPGFRLSDPAGKSYALSDFTGGPALLIAFICNHCPYVKHVAEALAQPAARISAARRGRGRDQFQRLRELSRTIRRPR